MPFITKQPGKGLYVLYAIGATLLQMPLWVLKYITAHGRQHPTWTFSQAFGERLLTAFLHITARIQIDGALTLEPGKEKTRFTIINPAAPPLYTGPLRSNPDVAPVPIGATWYPAPLPASTPVPASATVVLHLHGGAFVIGDGRTEASGFFATTILAQTRATHILMPQYRLSTLPASSTSNPFPAALQDALGAYLYLLRELRVPPAQIILSGDSAGGNLALQLLRYIGEFGRELEIAAPGAVWLFSPWLSPAGSVDARELVANPHFAKDYLPVAFVAWGCAAYAGTKGVEVLAGKYVEGLGNAFATEAPIWVNTGAVEVLYFQIKRFVDEMKGVEGNRVVFDIEEDAPHDVCLVGNINGFKGAGERTAKRAGEWWEGVRGEAGKGA